MNQFPGQNGQPYHPPRESMNQLRAEYIDQRRPIDEMAAARNTTPNTLQRRLNRLGLKRGQKPK